MAGPAERWNGPGKTAPDPRFSLAARASPRSLAPRSPRQTRERGQVRREKIFPLCNRRRLPRAPSRAFEPPARGKTVKSREEPSQRAWGPESGADPGAGERGAKDKNELRNSTTMALSLVRATHRGAPSRKDFFLLSSLSPLLPFPLLSTSSLSDGTEQRVQSVLFWNLFFDSTSFAHLFSSPSFFFLNVFSNSPSASEKKRKKLQ